VTALRSVSETVEQEYEETESPESLARVAQAKTDLARNLLATGANDAAVEEAETAVDLLQDIDTSILSAEQLAKVQLSARLHYFNHALDAAIPYFRTSLEATNSNPDIICLLAEVLWAKGGEQEKQARRARRFIDADRRYDGPRRRHGDYASNQR
jgi:superkiller protein 3